MQKIKDKLAEIRKEAYKQLDPERAVVLLQQCAALLGSTTDGCITAEMAYNHKLEELSGQSEKVTEAKIKAKATEEYEYMKRCEALVEVNRELINALKYTIKVKTDERRYAGSM